MTTETWDKAIRKMNNIRQKGPVEDYIIEFKLLVPLTGYNDYALVATFKKGLYPTLGYEIMRMVPNPPNNNVDAWYERVMVVAMAS